MGMLLGEGGEGGGVQRKAILVVHSCFKCFINLTCLQGVDVLD